MKNAIFPGSFDPIHGGHIDIIKRASKLFDNLYIVVSVNISKKSKPLKERYLETKKVVDGLKLKNVKVFMNENFTIDFANKHKCKYIVRSLRDTKDFKYELTMAQSNYKLESNLETILFFSNPSLTNISSHAIREIQKNMKVLKKD